MHMADALLAPTVAGVMYACSAGAAVCSIRKIKEESRDKLIPLMGVMGAFVFAAQMINFTIPGTGSSGHLCGGVLLSAVVGPYAAFLTMICVLLIQCLLFADGGLLALGANIWNMAFYGCFIGGMIWQLALKQGISKKKIITVSLFASIITLQLGAFSVSAETFASGITELPFTAFLFVMQPIHLAIGAVEGLITAAVLVFLYEARPSLLRQSEPAPIACGRLSFGKIIAVLTAATAVTAGILSQFASAFPDGLEWSVERLTGNTELEGTKSGIYIFVEEIQRFTAVLPDFNFIGAESAAGTSVSGLAGAAVVLISIILIGRCFKKVAHSHKPDQ